jgi:hypothetical protein
MNWGYVRETLTRVALPAWFAVVSIALLGALLAEPRRLFFDARLYLEATRAWLAGNDPWQVQLDGIYFAAPPPSLLPFAPLAAVPADVGASLVALAVVAGAVAGVRLLRLPWWWLLFPPLVECVISANVQGLLIALILGRLGAVAGIMKIYAAVPMVFERRWRALALLAAALLVTVPVLPWGTFLAELPTITARLQAQTTYALPTLVLVALSPVAGLAMLVLGRERSAWLVVPALWPAQQYYYGALAMGARSGLAAAIVAVPVPGSGLLALVTLAVVEYVRGGRTIGAVTSRTAPLDSDP